MKLKPQPRAQKPRATRATRGATRARPRSTPRGSGRMARRPGISLRRRVGARMPSFRRLIAGVGAVAAASVLAAALYGPWLLVTDVAWAGNHYTAAADLRDALENRRGASLLAVDTDALVAEIEELPAVASVSVTAGIGGRLEATVVEREAVFVWLAGSQRFLGAADGTIFASELRGSESESLLTGLPRIADHRSTARLVTVGDVIPAALLRTALRVARLDPALLGSNEGRLEVHLDDEYGFRLLATRKQWEVALGVYGIDPRETSAEADERLERQVAAVRTLFAAHREADVRWVDVRNPGRVYFRANG
jgi:POTRA domain, FtsQ-type